VWKPWQWARVSNERAVGNARSAATDLGRSRVERYDVELFLRAHLDRSAVAARAATRPA
jgi:hypothetical protein